MHACNRINALLATRASPAKRDGIKNAKQRVTKQGLIAFALAITGVSAWRAWRHLLALLPDSNDDFSLH
ncbi:hypothetical protein [Paraburkholderia saeva]|uniref:Uncharacterized protein n=1 Tax=Paraburkholderia saeva TaxID=2777537 RepID=A0A9N8RZ40_9BURK|nr:hypothetical protein [Paraburkholderia saeva]CAG4888722.1 hypothetical protein R52603_00751 [Paraburkholderia saeva]CAG4893748.1 hypothetical protein R70241_01635 [Paraburkholderia saeva]CAG4916059.1 hypothetical protein LMG31841_04534 [Paraburkholderia saeva]